jgi:hypothetical protein
VGLHCVAASDGERGVLITADIEAARDAIARADFFGRAFAVDQPDQEELHRAAAARHPDERRRMSGRAVSRAGQT